MRANNDKYRLYFVAVMVTFIDMLVKVIVKNNLLLGERNTIIKDVVYFTYVKNTGAAWSMFKNNTLFLIVITALIIIGLLYYVTKHFLDKYELLGYGMILGGAVGNLIDRVMYGYVIDYIDIIINGYDYPVFNIADMAIVIGVGILFVGMIRGDKNGNKSREANKN